MIEVSAVTKLYGEQKALNNVSFSIGKGEIVGFLGPNGAGKSTMMKILTGFISASEGHVSVAGVPVSADNINSRYKVGYLPENNPLYTDMYVKEYLAFVAGFYNIKQVKNRVDELIEMIGLRHECHKKIGALSKGYRQRVGLAQALMSDPEVLILDEPTTGLDPNQIVEVRDLIIALGKEKTIMLSTHIMQEVQAICERAIVIKKGEIVADALVSELNAEDSKKTVIHVEFEADADIAALKKLEDVLEISQHGKTYIVTSKTDIRKEISVLASEKQWLILSMSVQKETLEDVFRELTR